MIVITGATGQLGRLTIDALLQSVPSRQLIAAVRDPAKAADMAALGVQVRHADYNQPQTLVAAFAGAEKLLLISSSEVGQRVAQHQAVIEAARAAKIGLIAYTSILHAPTSPLGLADEHRQTERLLEESGIPFVLLRNGWYSENYTAAAPAAVASGTLHGSAGEGRIASAARADYAAAAAAVLTHDDQAGRVHELAGDAAYTLTELAAEIASQSGRPVAYQNLPEADYRAALIGAGLPTAVADLLADSDSGAAQGGLFDESGQLSALIGRPTTPLASTLAIALQG